jgi:hypothetical protein
MKRKYVEERAGGYWITGRRVSFDSMVYAFLRGASRESIDHIRATHDWLLTTDLE